MTFKLNPEVRKIISPVILVFPDGSQKEYECGSQVADAGFDHRYIIESLKAEDGVVILTLAEQKIQGVNWTGEEEVSFF